MLHWTALLGESFYSMILLAPLPFCKGLVKYSSVLRKVVKGALEIIRRSSRVLL